jgi:hypothetical protein
VIACPVCCAHCREALAEADQTPAARFDKMELPKVKPVVTRGPPNKLATISVAVGFGG